MDATANTFGDTRGYTEDSYLRLQWRVIVRLDLIFIEVDSSEADLEVQKDLVPGFMSVASYRDRTLHTHMS